MAETPRSAFVATLVSVAVVVSALGDRPAVLGSSSAASPASWRSDKDPAEEEVPAVLFSTKEAEAQAVLRAVVGARR